MIDLDGDIGHGTWTIQAPVVGRQGSPIGAGPRIIIGRYYEEYARDANGWRWTRLACVFDAFATSQGGWAEAQFNG
ncbi:MAG: nuclear transport factor 2 family protein [Salinisphaera sp.]|nr:nuclear transport factor 2 family protein [Salinisphaera sp.]